MEHACQSETGLLQGCRSSKHDDINNFGIAGPMTKLICRGVYNIKSYIMIKVFGVQRHGSLGMRTVTGSNTFGQRDSIEYR